VNTPVVRSARRVGTAVLASVAVVRAGLAGVVYGMEGVNRTVRFAPRSSVIAILRAFGAHIADGCDIESGLIVHNATSSYGQLTVGARSHLGKDVFVDLADRVTLEDCVTISMRTTILTHVDVGHSPLAVSVLPRSCAAVLIRRGAYVGAGAILLPGVEIGDCAVVGAGSVVTRSVAPYTVVAGSPARLLRTITAPLQTPAGS
jgi:UDP-2-acetamido-3-amino-2,3-dideoxy-glucuronate N-acetyltransferase